MAGQSDGFLPLDRRAFRELIDTFPEKMQRNAMCVWLEILMQTNQHPGVDRGMPLERGQLRLAGRELAAAARVSYQNVRTVIKWSKKLGNLTQHLTQEGVRITVINFDTYVRDRLSANPTSNPALTQRQPSGSRKRKDLTQDLTQTGGQLTLLDPEVCDDGSSPANPAANAELRTPKKIKDKARQ